MSPETVIKCETKIEFVSITIDGVEAIARDGEMLIDAAKKANVEIPYFCYEPKLGPPVGACRMCLVEVEGIPKLQTACSTPVKDGMVVNTVSNQVKEVQEAVAEFLLVNHPLDCPVCDKGGECPLQDVTMGWGPEQSRTVEAKRHFEKPVKLSPLITIDRERCILCYRCVRFSQEVSEDDQLALIDRGAATYVGTFDSSEYIAPFSGNVTELCPVGALTSTEYRFKARPWDIESSSSICTLCPAQCNVKFTVRDEKIERVLARDEMGNPGVDDGWLCDKGRYAFKMFESADRVTEPMVRRDGSLQSVSWDEALDAAASGLRKAAPNVAAVIGGQTTNEEGFLVQALMRQALGSSHIDSRIAGKLSPNRARQLNRPELQASVQDLDDAELIIVLDTDPINEMAVLDLRIRKAVRLGDAKLVVATSAPTTLDANAACIRHQPASTEALLTGLTKAFLDLNESDSQAGADNPESYGLLKEGLESSPLEDLTALAAVDPQDLRNLAELGMGSEKTVIVFGERVGHGMRGDSSLKSLVNIAQLFGCEEQNAGGLLEVTTGTNGRGLRDVGCLPNMEPGLRDSEVTGLSTAEMPDSLKNGKLDAIYLLHSDPVRDLPNSPGWVTGLKSANFVVAHAQFLSDEMAETVDVVFPSESYAEKQGTVTHPDGRIQRLRSAVPKPDQVRMEWQVLTELSERLGMSESAQTASAIYESIRKAVSYYAGVELADTTRHGVRWQESYSVADAAEVKLGLMVSDSPPAPTPLEGSSLRLGIRSSLWASIETDRSEPLKYLKEQQRVLLSAHDAEKLGISNGDTVLVSGNGNSIEAIADVAATAVPGTAFLFEGAAENGASVLSSGEPLLVEVEVKRS